MSEHSTGCKIIKTKKLEMKAIRATIRRREQFFVLILYDSQRRIRSPSYKKARIQFYCN